MMQRHHCRSLLQSVEEKAKTSKTISKTMQEVYSAFGVSEGSQGFIGHGLAMHSSNVYLEGDCKATFKRIRKYAIDFLDPLTPSYINCISESRPSPFLYPVGGKAAICQVFEKKLYEFGPNCDILLNQYEISFIHSHIDSPND